MAEEKGKAKRILLQMPISS